VLMVIFGAGASFDSFAECPPGSDALDQQPQSWQLKSRPPLAQQLFSLQYGEHAAKYRECQGLFPDLRRALSVEEELERISLESIADPHVQIELLALRYYIRDVIQHSMEGWHGFTSYVTNYSELLRRLRSWRGQKEETVCLVTFNYDNLLENAWNGVLHRGWDTLSSFTDDVAWKLIKLHGSIDWVHRAENADLSTLPGDHELDEEVYERAVYFAALRSATQLRWTGEYRTQQEVQGEETRLTEDGSVWLPAIAMPTQTKTTFECPQKQLDELDRLIPRVTKLLLVGWRGAERHFLSRWRVPQFPQDFQRIQIVAGSPRDANETNQNLELATVTCQDVRLCSDGFTGFLDSDDLSRFLEDEDA
jgi:hypothetical protein